MSLLCTTEYLIFNAPSVVGHTQLTFFNLFIKYFELLKNVSCEYDRLNGWNSTLQAAWYIRHVRWTCLFCIGRWYMCPGGHFSLLRPRKRAITNVGHQTCLGVVYVMCCCGVCNSSAGHRFSPDMQTGSCSRYLVLRISPGTFGGTSS